ncbi:mitochondrial intermediate peptidase-like protein [Amylocarpus encephaloides]|uniref:Mitochondrial intermediate peptidase n=1 Tax=Amylocarpus encephaloides TaxID=45428 RepID=A0A9P7YR59_9HELO|nr:mitochondrial intermediate peptidase-like protein [Amylocarpus encephaloides]
MLKAASSGPWICARCIRRQRPFRRLHFTQTPPSTNSLHKSIQIPTGSAKEIPDLFQVKAVSTRYDDANLRQVFDSPAFWREFSQHSKTSYGGPNSGLFQNKYLTGPEGFEKFAWASLKKAQRIAKEVLAIETREEQHKIVRKLDRLSDLLCRVIDISDFVRSTHPSRSIQAAAMKAHSMVYEYMNTLNATTGLAHKLQDALKDSSAPWGEQERRVAEILDRDFSKSAIDLPEQQKDRFVSISQEINNVGFAFTESVSPQKEYLTFNKRQLDGLDPGLIQEFSDWGTVRLPVVGAPALQALRNVKDPDVRKEIFMASRTADQHTITMLETLLRKRAELAKLVDYKSYGHLTLQDKMAQSPSNVTAFLGALRDENEELVAAQLGKLEAMKAADIRSGNPEIQAWDKEYYMARKILSERSRVRRPDFISSYFSLGTVMQGLSRLFTRLYGVSLVPHESHRGETWNPDVRRLDVVSETEGTVAVLYCDLFSRHGKSPNPAHFTLRCSRLIEAEEIDEYRSMDDPLFKSPVEAANDGMSTSAPREDGSVMQLPAVALICDFEQANSAKPALLSFGEVVTLFHEMGHAIHSIIGRTEFQEISGTRVATDFAELPSILMEHFAADQSVLSMFARHHETDKPLPYEMIAEQLALERQVEAIDVDNQITLAFLDQELHSELAMEPSFDSTKIYHDIQDKWSKFPSDPPGTCWQGFFGHLHGYGGSYYSYLFDRVLAKRIWHTVFNCGSQQGAVTRENGEKYKNEVLKWGGGRDPWVCLGGATGDIRLVDEGYRQAVGFANLAASWRTEAAGYAK